MSWSGLASKKRCELLISMVPGLAVRKLPKGEGAKGTKRPNDVLMASDLTTSE